jgi:hypothetical protein
MVEAFGICAGAGVMGHGDDGGTRVPLRAGCPCGHDVPIVNGTRNRRPLSTINGGNAT